MVYVIWNDDKNNDTKNNEPNVEIFLTWREAERFCNENNLDIEILVLKWIYNESKILNMLKGKICQKKLRHLKMLLMKL